MRSTKGTRGMESTRGFRKLIVWQRMTELVKLVYHLTNNLPKSETFGLISQIRRAVVSVISNFVEGYLKSSKKEKVVYLERSMTSLMELDAQAEICVVLGYFAENDFETFSQKRSEWVTCYISILRKYFSFSYF